MIETIIRKKYDGDKGTFEEWQKGLLRFQKSSKRTNAQDISTRMKGNTNFSSWWGNNILCLGFYPDD